MVYRDLEKLNHFYKIYKVNYFVVEPDIPDIASEAGSSSSDKPHSSASGDAGDGAEPTEAPADDSALPAGGLDFGVSRN